MQSSRVGIPMILYTFVPRPYRRPAAVWATIEAHPAGAFLHRSPDRYRDVSIVAAGDGRCDRTRGYGPHHISSPDGYRDSITLLIPVPRPCRQPATVWATVEAHPAGAFLHRSPDRYRDVSSVAAGDDRCGRTRGYGPHHISSPDAYRDESKFLQQRSFLVRNTMRADRFRRQLITFIELVAGMFSHLAAGSIHPCRRTSSGTAKGLSLLTRARPVRCSVCVVRSNVKRRGAVLQPCT
jgi:hypothetical protein